MRLKANSKPLSVHALVLSAGSGTRTGLAYNKVLHLVGKKTVLEMSVDALIDAGVDKVTVVAAQSDIDAVRELLKDYGSVGVCAGGDTRTESAKRGLEFIEPCDIALIHDGARPFASRQVILASIESAARYGSGIAALPAVDTIKQVGADGKITTLDRSTLYNVQTPQSFDYARIKSAYEKFDGTATDDSAVYEAAGFNPVLTAGSAANRKITTREDLFGLEAGGLKIGIGFDVHELTVGRKLILGGVEIPHRTGLLGHSDADVLVHAVMDALLSAAGLPDIGVLFPDNDPTFEGADSIKLMERVCEKVRGRGYEPENISAVVMAQKPKLAGHIPQMRARIASAAGLPTESVNVSATTTEHLGIIGNERGIAASATVLIKENTKG